MDFAIPPDLDLEFARQRVDHGNAHAVQPARVVIVFVVELAAGVQPREDELNPGDFVLGMHVHRHTPAVVDNLDRTILEEPNVDRASVTRERFVDAVVHHLLDQMVGASGIRIHAGTAPHRV